MHKTKMAIVIGGLGCGGDGAARIEGLLRAKAGVLTAYVNPFTEMAYIEFDSGTVRPVDLSKTIRKAGYLADAVSVR